MGYIENNKCQPEKIMAQLHRIEGQVRSIETMYNDQRNVEEIIRVVKAARASLDSVAYLLVANKVNGCYDKGTLVQKKELLNLIDVLFDIT